MVPRVTAVPSAILSPERNTVAIEQDRSRFNGRSPGLMARAASANQVVSYDTLR